jgi:hypothetical protein
MCVVQVALAVMLLIGATLLGRSLVRLLHVDLGVSTDHVLTASMNLAFGERPTDAQTLARVDRVIENIRALPGVRAVGVGTSLPPNVSRIRVLLQRQGDVVDHQIVAMVPATPGYFSALQMRLISGRFFTDADDEHHPPVTILSQDAAGRFFGTDDPLGRTVSLPVMRNGKNTSTALTVVGITSNVKYAGLAAPAEDIVYRPFAQQPWVAPFLVVRTSGNPTDFALTLRRGQGDHHLVGDHTRSTRGGCGRTATISHRAAVVARGPGAGDCGDRVVRRGRLRRIAAHQGAWDSYRARGDLA